MTAQEAKNEPGMIGRVLASKDHEYPFYFDGNCFRDFNYGIELDRIRSNGDFFSIPTYVRIAFDTIEIDRLNKRIAELESFIRGEVDTIHIDSKV